MSAENFRSVLGALRSQKKEGERRNKPRVGVRATIEICFNPGGRPARMMAHLRDMCSGGVGLLVNSVLHEGETFSIELPQIGTEEKFRVECEVRHVKVVGTSLWRIGAKFVAGSAEVQKTSPN